MNLKIRILLTLLVFALVAARAGDRGNLVFTDTIHDFGDIMVADGAVTCQFEFVNTSDSTIYILGALSSCNCTTVDYPRQAIEPGQGGVVRVTYDPVGRPAGPFDRTVLLQLSGARRRLLLRFCGNALAPDLPLERPDFMGRQ